MASASDRPKQVGRKSGLVAAAAAALAAPIALAPAAEAAARPHAVESPRKPATSKTTGHVTHTTKSGTAKSISWRGNTPAKSITWGSKR